MAIRLALDAPLVFTLMRLFSSNSLDILYQEMYSVPLLKTVRGKYPTLVVKLVF